MVVAASQHQLGMEAHAQNIPSGRTPLQGPRHVGSNPFRGPNPNPLERQQVANWPFFYVQPSQPYLPCQWPMPMPYVPFGGFHGMGYGMVLPPFPPASFVDAPGYILPHSQLHLVDYRRMMTPHPAPTMAYQARRFRYQHTTPSGCVMVSSEVQTEPVCANSQRQGCHVPTSIQRNSESAKSADSSSVLSSVPNEARAAHPETSCTVAGLAAVQNGGILFEAEEVRIECRGSPSAMKITRSKETAELASNADGELLRCNVGSAEDVLLGCFQLAPFKDEARKDQKDLSQLDDPCPDILMVSCPSNGFVSTLEGSVVAPVEPVNSTLVVQGESSLAKGAQEVFGDTKNIGCKILRLPVDLQCLEELRQMEASVWSVESLLPYVPTSEWMVQNNPTNPGNPSLATVMEVPAESGLQSTPSPADATPSLPDAGTVIELGQDSTTSLESVPPFLSPPSQAAKLGVPDYDNQSFSFQNTSNPGNLVKNQPESNLDIKVQCGHRSPVDSVPEKLKDETTDRSVVSAVGLNNLEKCAGTLFPESPLKHKVRMCNSCSVKRRGDVRPGSPKSKVGCMKRHKVSRPPTCDKIKVPLCAACLHAPEKKARCKVATITANNGCNMNDEMSEVSENDLDPSKSCSKGLYDVQSLHSGKHLEKCPVSHQTKLREQNCSCEETKASLFTSAWNTNGRVQHKDLTWERNEDGRHLSAMERWTDSERRFSGEKPWRASTQGSDSESSKNGGKIKTHNKKKQFTQSLDVHRRDTRC